MSFDYESQDLGATGKDPLDSSFTAKEMLLVEKTPIAGRLLGESFSGKPFQRPEVNDLLSTDDEWMEWEGFVDVEWGSLESRLS